MVIVGKGWDGFTTLIFFEGLPDGEVNCGVPVSLPNRNPIQPFVYLSPFFWILRIPVIIVWVPVKRVKNILMN